MMSHVQGEVAAIAAWNTRPAPAAGELAALAEAWVSASRNDDGQSETEVRVERARAAFHAALAAHLAEAEQLREDNAAMMKQIEESQMNRLAKGDALLADKTPHRCPVCDGRGQVLFNPDTPYSNGTSAGPWICRPCMGSGILWAVQFAEDRCLAALAKKLEG